MDGRRGGANWVGGLGKRNRFLLPYSRRIEEISLRFYPFQNPTLLTV